MFLFMYRVLRLDLVHSTGHSFRVSMAVIGEVERVGLRAGHLLPPPSLTVTETCHSWGGRLWQRRQGKAGTALLPSWHLSRVTQLSWLAVPQSNIW